MNTPITFKLKQLLFSKGWRYKLSKNESGHRVNNSLAEQRWNEGDLTYVDITISEIIMWLYDKHGIWIMVNVAANVETVIKYEIRTNKIQTIKLDNYGDFRETITSFERFSSPTESYLAAIEYTLKNLI